MIKMILKQYRWLLLSASIFSALSAIASILLISYVNQHVAGFGSGNEPALERIMAFVGGLFTMVLLGTLSQILLAKLSTSVVSDLRSRIIRKVLCTDYEKIEAAGGHRLQATVTTDVGSIATSLTLLPTLMFNLTTVLLCLSYLAYLSLVHFAMLLLSLVVMVAGAYFLMGFARQYFMKLREQEDSLFNSFKTLIDGGKELNLNSRRKRWFYHNMVCPSVEKIQKTEFTAQLYWSVNSNWTNLTLFGLLGLVVYGFNRIMPTTVDVIIGYIFVIIYFIGPLTFVISSMQPITRGVVAYRKVQSLQLADDSQFALPEPEQPIENWQQLDIAALEYDYPTDKNDGRHFGVGPIDLTIKQGQLLFVTGGNGSGKSTFAKLLTGLYTPAKGTITLAGQQINEQNQHWYRNYFSTIFSDFFLFSQVLDKQGELADDSQIEAILEKLQLSGKVTADKGIISNTQLSQGQRKRLALLVSYMEDAPIYLFDEWAADQDPHFRHYFYHDLLPGLINKGKTVIAITHDERYFHLADRVLKFDDGLMSEVKVDIQIKGNA